MPRTGVQIPLGSPFQFPRKRIEKAQLLLLTTHDSQEKIAWDVGFSDLSYFCRQFKKYTQMSPGRYRRHQFSYFLS